MMNKTIEHDLIGLRSSIIIIILTMMNKTIEHDFWKGKLSNNVSGDSVFYNVLGGVGMCLWV